MNNRFNQKWRRAIFQTIVVAILLSGCGGGGGGGGEDDASSSSDANLSELSLTGAALDQLFQPSQTVYSASVDFLQTSVILTPVANHADAIIQVNGYMVASGDDSAAIALSEGQNLITLVVTAEDGVTTQSYSIEILRDGSDSFAQQAYLKASNADAYDYLGTNVAISGDTLVVGAPFEDGNASGGEDDNSAQYAGAAYVFTCNNGVWSQQAYLKASNAGGLEASNIVGKGINPYWFYPPGDLFGYSVAISGDTLVVGAPQEESSASGGESDNSAYRAGAAYIFTRSDGVWSQQAYLKASNAEAGDIFGDSVSISGDTLVVGAPGEDSSPRGGEDNNWAEDSGAAYVFTRSDGAWNQQAMLKAKNPDEDSIWIAPGDTTDQFGKSVAISHDTLVVGAPTEDSSTSGGADDNSTANAGAAYVFTRSNGVWNRQAILKASNADADDYFGMSVAISGDTLVVGAQHEDSSASGGMSDNSVEDAGAAYVFTRSGDVWSQQAYLKASNAEAADQFGDSVAISGDTLVVGVPYEASSASGGEADNSSGGAGAAYVFTRSDGIWIQLAYLKASNAEADDMFGDSVALSGNTLVVGAPGEDASATGGEADNSSIGAGAAYVWQ